MDKELTDIELELEIITQLEKLHELLIKGKNDNIRDTYKVFGYYDITMEIKKK